MTIKNVSFLLFCFIVQSNIYSQGKEYLDYIVTKNDDTIYGTVRQNLLRVVLLEKT